MKFNSKFFFIFAASLVAKSTVMAATVDSAGAVIDLPAEIAAPNTPVIAIHKVNSFCEGPAWDGNGRVTFSSTNMGKVFSYQIATKTQTEFFTLQAANGQEWGPDGRLYACGKGGLYSYDAQGQDKKTVFTSTPDPNDLSIDSKGNMYFSTYNNAFSFKGANGTAKAVNPKAYSASNGIEFMEESGILYVNDYRGNLINKYTATADGTLSNETLFASVSSPDGITLDEKGNVYVSSGMNGTIVVFNPAGTKLGEIAVTNPIGGDAMRGIAYNTSNCVFGGADRKTLYITGDGGLYSVQMNVAGRQRPSSTSVLAPQIQKSNRKTGSTFSQRLQALGLLRQQAKTPDLRFLIGQH
jgi:sugar lactone lactonase YvrE